MPRRSSGGRAARKPARLAPRHAKNSPSFHQAPRAPPSPPAPSRGGSGGSFYRAMSDGLAWCTGIAVAERAVDAVMGRRTILHGPANNGGYDACTQYSKAFLDVSSPSSLSKCQFYMDTLVACRRSQVP